MRTFLASLLRWLAEALVRLYYPRRIVEGLAHVPASGPALYVANHPNGLLDPLVFRVCTGHAVRFLAKSTLWGNPFGRLAMDAFSCLPVYRQQDVGPHGAGLSAARNEESFARCRAELAAGAELALYPEGTSHTEPGLKPLKTGAARLALSAASEAASSGGQRRAPLLVPAGSHYEAPAAFRSAVDVVIGAPIELSRHLVTFAADERQAIEQLTEEIRVRLTELVLLAETRTVLDGVARVAGNTRRFFVAADRDDDDAARDGADDADRSEATRRNLSAAYATLKASDPARAERVVGAARRYERVLTRLGVGDPWAVAPPSVSATEIMTALARAVLMLPAAAWGALTSWVPYRLSTAVSRRMTRDEDVLSTIKMIVGTTFLVAAWIAEAITIGVLWGAPLALLSLLVAPAAGYAALRWSETLEDIAETLRQVGGRWRSRASAARHLGHRRRLLAEQLIRDLGEVGR